MTEEDLINERLPDELLAEVLGRLGACGGSGAKRDLDACALVCRRWRLLERACRRSAKLVAYGGDADEVLRLLADRFPALAEVSIDEQHADDARMQSVGMGSKSVRRCWLSQFGWTSNDVLLRNRLTDAGICHLVHRCKSLEKLSLRYCCTSPSSPLTSIAQNCKSLKSLHLEACNVGDQGLIAIGKGCKLLNDLILDSVKGLRDEGFVGLVQNRGRSLVSLRIVGFTCYPTAGWITDTSLHAVGSYCSNLEILSLLSDCVTSEGIVSVAKGCQLLTTLRLCCEDVGDEALETVGSFCSSLETLLLSKSEKFTDRGLYSIAKGCKKLTDLILRRCPSLTDKSVEFVARSCKKLAQLEIERCKSIETAALEYVGQLCPGLLKISLLECPRIHNNSFLEVARGCFLIQSLRLAFCDGINDAAICHIAQGCRNLRELIIESCEIGDKAILSVGENCKLLIDLIVRTCDSITTVSDAGLNAIAEGCFLRKLEVCGCDQITDNGITAIARGCPDLVSLHIAAQKNIGDMALAEIGEGCPQLKEISLTFCPKITDAGLAHIAKGCPQLELCLVALCCQVTATGPAAVVSSCSKLKNLYVTEPA